MDAWEILEANTTAGDAWTRLHAMGESFPGKHVTQGDLVVYELQNQIQLTPIAETLTITTEQLFTLTDDIKAQALTQKSWQLT